MTQIKLIWDDDFDNPKWVELETEIYIQKRLTKTGSKEVELERVKMPGRMVYPLKRFNPQNAGWAYEQDDGTLWIDTTNWLDGISSTIIMAYSDGYGKDWMLD